MSPEGPVLVNRREGEGFSDKKDSMSNCSDHEIMVDRGEPHLPTIWLGQRVQVGKWRAKELGPGPPRPSRLYYGVWTLLRAVSSH